MYSILNYIPHNIKRTYKTRIAHIKKKKKHSQHSESTRASCAVLVCCCCCARLAQALISYIQHAILYVHCASCRRKYSKFIPTIHTLILLNYNSFDGVWLARHTAINKNVQTSPCVVSVSGQCHKQKATITNSFNSALSVSVEMPPRKRKAPGAEVANDPEPSTTTNATRKTKKPLAANAKTTTTTTKTTATARPATAAAAAAAAPAPDAPAAVPAPARVQRINAVHAVVKKAQASEAFHTKYTKELQHIYAQVSLLYRVDRVIAAVSRAVQYL